MQYAAKSAIDYAENLVPVMKVELIDDLQASIEERNQSLNKVIAASLEGELSTMG